MVKKECFEKLYNMESFLWAETEWGKRVISKVEERIVSAKVTFPYT